MNRQQRRIAQKKGAAPKPSVAQAAALASEAAQCYRMGRLDDAEKLYRKTLSLNKAEASNHSNLGVVLQAQGKLDDAARCHQQALALDPNNAAAHYNLGNVFKAQEKPDDAARHYRQALSINPNHAQAHNNLGNVLKAQGRLEEACTHLQKALALKPDYIEACNNLGAVLKVLGRLDEAVSCYERLLALKPDFAEAYNNLGSTLKAQGRFDKAMACYDQAIRLKPDFADAHLNKGLLHLLEGNLEAGFEESGWRWGSKNTPTRMRDYPQPLWDGKGSSARRVLIWNEQAIGDEIMFAGLIPDVLRTGVTCILKCTPRLKPIFMRSFPDIEIMSGDDNDPEFDAHLPGGNLFSLFRRNWQDFAATPDAYLKPDPVLLEQCRARCDNSKRRIGLAWHTKNWKTGFSRSMELAQLKPLFEKPGIQWINLQYGDFDDLENQAKEADVPLFIDRAVDQLADIDAFAAQIAALDLVITIDNSTAHLAGALGIPAIVMLPFVPDWRWFLAREDCPWYPSLRLVRQSGLDDWDSVVQKIADYL